MKTPAELKMRLRRQWENADTRESRLLNLNAWPIQLSIGKPSAAAMRNDYGMVKQHLEAWRRVKIGEVRWETVQYRATAEPVNIPTRWLLYKPSEWIGAAADAAMRQEFDFLAQLVASSESSLHRALIRRRSLWRGKSITEVLQAAQLAMSLEPGCAEDRPLRTLAIDGIDTKFFERNASLVTALLDERFGGEVSKLGLETFLGAYIERGHWLLVVDLDGSLLTFPRQRVASSDLVETRLPGSRLLIVENETCQHQLPKLPDTIAILGAGFDLEWMLPADLSEKSIGYWGDIDTWGLKFLGKARRNAPQLRSLLMSEEVYEANRHQAVAEPVVAGTDVPGDLLPGEQSLYRRLVEETCGRLEQEFLPVQLVESALKDWAGCPDRGGESL